MFATLLKKIKDARLLPRISETERQALAAGSVWIDGQFFSGNPDFSAMLAESYPKLLPHEQAFMDGPVEALMQRVDRWALHQTRRVPDEIWQFLRDNGFFGLIIPKEYGGSGFSVLARSAVMMKTSALGPINSLIVIPNTLGAAELLITYGTQAQKNRYLPGLAKGDYVPCFALTESSAGSDAASIAAEGVVFRDDDGQAKIRLNFSKRYITLAPVANLVSLAVDLYDPGSILGKGEHPGITVIMLEKGTPGLQLGDHHLPISAFDNGPIVGRDVIAPVDNIVGGGDNAGGGWRMLMEQLSGGRAVSLPAGAVASAKSSAAAAGPYSMVREQFGIPVGAMEGVEAKIARIAAMAYMTESARVYVCAGVDNGHHPPVISAILKQQTTAIAQQSLIDGMDVMAGVGVMQGPNNILGAAYAGAPVNITVEGANILTRTLIIFGQGAVRCHPFALNTLDAVAADDVAAFRSAMVGWMGHTTKNFFRGLARGLTRGWTVRCPLSGETAQYVRKLGWAASRFAFLTDLALFLVGGKLKARGKLSGRFADALSWMLFGVTTLRRFEAEGSKAEDLALVHWAMRYSLYQVQQAFEGIYANFDVPVLGWLLRHPGRFWLRVNPLSTGPDDTMDRAVAAAIQSPGEQYGRVALAGLGNPRAHDPGLGRLLHAWRQISAAAPATTKVRKAMHKKQIDAAGLLEALDPAVDAGVITREAADAIRAAEDARLAAIQVDVFSADEYYRDTAAPEKQNATPTMARAANQ